MLEVAFAGGAVGALVNSSSLSLLRQPLPPLLPLMLLPAAACLLCVEI